MSTMSNETNTEDSLPLDLNGHYEDTDSTLYNPNLTYSFDKYSCVREMWFVHMVFNYFVFLSGIVCLITRIAGKRFLWIHKWSGRVYILSMLWTTCSSIVINNTGLPLATLYSFLGVMLGLSIGWIAILIYKNGIEKKAMKLAQEELVEMNADKTKDGNVDLQSLLQDCTTKVLKQKTWKERYFSLKTLHGVFFFMSWFQITGRMFASNQSGDFTCYTYPVYKPIDTPQAGDNTDVIKLVPTNDPNWDSLPWSNSPLGFSMMTILGSMAFAVVAGAIWTYFDVRKDLRDSTEENDEPSLPSAEDEAMGEKESEEPKSNDTDASKKTETLDLSSKYLDLNEQ
mmetsp:Transcript_126423/g.178453  ORF Transcript_126423/g.178453 Transcript_126423/m.178453 type:complete len:341 (-) Transcript_126423:22-1044(-)